MPRHAPQIALDTETQSTLNKLIKTPSTAQALVIRSRIVLSAAAGRSNQEIVFELRIPEVMVSKWRRSFARSGMEGLRDRARSGRPCKHDEAVLHKGQTRGCPQPESPSRRTGPTLAPAIGFT